MRAPIQLIVAISLATISCAAIFVPGCGGPDTRPATNDDFRAVQAAEAAQGRNLSIARNPGTACASACDAADVTCDGAGQICDLARQTEDLDLRVRCRAAEERCAEARAQDRDDCECPAAAP
ncbi:MAG: hypothetical protein JRH11_18025 [Deltaproteobacteria bacterium]|nr:hypothetical protein [Deltaproteobacteria bacterium]